MKTIMINVRDSFFSVVVLEIFEGTTRVLKTKIVPSTERGSFPEQGWQKFLAAFQPAGAFKQVVIVLHNANPWAGTGIEFTDGGECWFAHFETKGLEAVRHLTAKKYNVFVVDREDERRQAEAGKRAHQPASTSPNGERLSSTRRPTAAFVSSTIPIAWEDPRKP
jgi:hypothetical protein